MDLNGGLAVRGGGEDLALLGGDGGVALDQLGEHAAHRLDAEGQGSDVEEQQALDVAAEHAALDGCAGSDALIGVDALEAFLAGDALDGVLHGGNSRGAADEEDLAEVAGLEAGVGHGLAHGAHRRFDEVCGQLIELCAGQGHVEVLRAGGVRGDIGKIDVGGGHAGELDLGLFSRFLQALHGDLVGGEVDALGLLELVDEIVDDAVVEVVAAELGVAVGGQNLDDAVADVEDGHIEGAAAEVVDHDLLVGLFIDAVGESRGGGLVDDSLDLEAGDLAGVLGRLTLGVVEVGGDGDDGFGDGAAEIGLGVGLQLLKDHRGDFLRRIFLAVDLDAVVAAHVALDRGDRALVVRDGLTLCDLADHALAGLREGDDGRSRAVALGVGDDDGLAALHHSNAGIRGAKINTNDFRHIVFLLYMKLLFTNSNGLNWPLLPLRSGSRGRRCGSPSGRPRR